MGWFILLMVVILVVAIKCIFEIKGEKQRDIKRLMQILDKMGEIYKLAKTQQIEHRQADRFTVLMDDCLSILNKRTDEEWGDEDLWIASLYDESCKETYHQCVMPVKMVRNKVKQMASLVHMRASPPIPAGDEIQKLAFLREQGMISEDEFRAFSERFKLSKAEKVIGFIQAIKDLHSQYRGGAMTEGNYHAALWSLLDKLDRT